MSNDNKRMAALLAIRLGSIVGIAVTSYALYVEHKMEQAKKQGESYEALCDIRGDGFEASCTAVLGSTYGHILSHWGWVQHGSALDFSNATLGLLFYIAALFHDKLAWLIVNPPVVLVFAAAGSLAFSGYLAYILNVIIVSSRDAGALQSDVNCGLPAGSCNKHVAGETSVKVESGLRLASLTT